MLRTSIPLLSLVFASCASLHGSELRVGKTLEPRTGGGLGEEHGPAASTEASEVAVPTLPTAGPAVLPVDFAEPYTITDPPRSSSSALAQEGESLHGSRFTIKGGYYSAEDADALDDGIIINGSWTRFINKLLAIELEVGYLDADGEDGLDEVDLYGIPIMLNGRVGIPVWILEAYGGLGVGTIYYDADVTIGGVSADDDGFLLGGNIFIGASLNLADRIALGLEAKYYETEEIDDADATLEAFAVMLTLGFSR